MLLFYEKSVRTQYIWWKILIAEINPLVPDIHQKVT